MIIVTDNASLSLSLCVFTTRAGYNSLCHHRHQVFLMERICQDPLEKLFGYQGQCGGTHDNPTVHNFYKSTASRELILSWSTALKITTRTHHCSKEH
jgi:hypothetical protein